MDINNNIKKQILYRCLYTGTKETDILYNKVIVNKIDTLNTKDLKNLSNLFSEISDNEIFLILTKKAQVPNKYQTLINKLLK
tara:strand:+ start:264 stop:509 length:246 start_codon:yes stop_codon:yes gene_type:complete